MKNYKLFPLSALFFMGLMNAQDVKQDSLHKDKNVDEVIITGTLKPISKSKSPVPVEIYTKKFFEKNPTSNLLESISMVNGIRSQINCSVCNTGDIHINGLEGHRWNADSEFPFHGLRSEWNPEFYDRANRNRERSCILCIWDRSDGRNYQYHH